MTRRAWLALPFAFALAALPISQARAQAGVLSCDISATGVAFGAYNYLNALPNDSAGTITVNCRRPGPRQNQSLQYTIKLSAGLSGSFAQRKMASGPSRLGYNLYTTSTRTSIWGDGSAGTSFLTDVVVPVAAPTRRTFSVYGRIPTGQVAAGGMYQDAIVVTVEY